MAFDLDGSQFELVDNPRGEGTIDDFDQEVRLSNASAAGSRASAGRCGANYNYSKVDELQIITYGDNSLSNAGTNFIHESNVRNRGRMNNICRLRQRRIRPHRTA